MSRASRSRDARSRFLEIVENWFISEPLLFGVWTTHRIVVSPRVENIRVARGEIEYNPAFVEQLDDTQLKAVLQFEAVRILLKHPYGRRREDPVLSYLASNLTVQEYLHTALPHPRAVDVFGSREHDQQYFERYYALLLERALPGLANAEAGEASRGDGAGSPLELYADADHSGPQNTEGWEEDEFLSERVDDKIREAAEANQFGSLGGNLKEYILATLHPRLDYRAVLKHFRRSILSTERKLTRMRPNRRYGFDYLGSTYERATRLLVAVDVSGSMSRDDIAMGFSIVNRFFKTGIREIDVVTFDVELTSEVMSLRKAQRAIEVTGRGGTSFQAVIDLIDATPVYDGLIVFTDGAAPTPTPPTRRRTRIVWLIRSEEVCRALKTRLSPLGSVTFVKPCGRT